MQCPRCKSLRIQRGFNDTFILLRVLGVQELLCNKCSLEFKGFDPLRKLARAPSRNREPFVDRRRAPRFNAHLPAKISLVEATTTVGKLSYSPPSLGQCRSISKAGMLLGLIGSRFPEEDLSKPGRLLYVTVELPDGHIDAVVSIATSNRIGLEENKKRWLIGCSISQMKEDDKVRLAAYLERRAKEALVGEAG